MWPGSCGRPTDDVSKLKLIVAPDSQLRRARNAQLIAAAPTHHASRSSLISRHATSRRSAAAKSWRLRRPTNRPTDNNMAAGARRPVGLQPGLKELWEAGLSAEWPSIIVESLMEGGLAGGGRAPCMIIASRLRHPRSADVTAFVRPSVRPFLMKYDRQSKRSRPLCTTGRRRLLGPRRSRECWGTCSADDCCCNLQLEFEKNRQW